MAVDFLRYAQSFAQPSSNLTLSSMADGFIAQRRQAEQDAQKKEMNDMEMQKNKMMLSDMQRKQADSERRRNLLANLQPTETQVANPAYAEQQRQLSSIQGPVAPYQAFDGTANTGAPASLETAPPEWQAAQAIYAQPEQPKTLAQLNQPDYLGALKADYLKSGDLEGTKNVLTMQDILAQSEAKGDPLAYEKAKISASNYDNFVKRVTPLMKTSAGQAQAKQISEAYQKMHPEDATMYDVSNWQVTPAGTVNPVHGKDGNLLGNFITDAKGETTFHKVDKAAETWGTPEVINVGGKRAMVQRSSTGQIKPVIQDNSTTVKVGAGTIKPPAGYRYTADGNLEAIPGGPASAKAAANRMGIDNARATYDETTAVIDKLLTHPGRSTGTGTSSVIDPRNYIAGTDAKDFRNELASFDGKLFLANVSKMKGMGALSDPEGKKLTAAAGAIMPGMSDAAFVKNLNIIKEGLSQAKKRLDSGDLINTDNNPPPARVGNKAAKDPLGIL